MSLLAGLVAAALVIGVAVAGVLGVQPSQASPTAGTRAAEVPAAASDTEDSFPAAAPLDGPGGVSAEDGGVGAGVTVFDDAVPAVANLDADLRDALRRAATAAAREGVTFSVNSGWRSAAYQDRLLREAVADYGSAEEAARWVATSETSLHVQGAAIDIGGWDAAAWLDAHGSSYGLCRIYDNEPWHFELRARAVDEGCPALYIDPTHDPRMRS
ncbi:M15 family metallopeptidase [Microbacterium sp. SS28]|uniref:M15 family metallopeptidase n=1 Tax=Microbacterium sp. SS28 TaxID=2919948 RepID=UPI001FAA0AF9|nr:M15 family metallopeptidase [Microbacterium sp. SS28]